MKEWDLKYSLLEEDELGSEEGDEDRVNPDEEEANEEGEEEVYPPEEEEEGTDEL
jgi:hypothetical protein